MDFAPILALLVAALGSGTLVAIVQGCIQRAKLSAEVRKLDADTGAVHVDVINKLTGQIDAAQELIAELRGQLADVASLRIEVETLRRQLGTRKDELAEIRERLRQCEERHLMRAGGAS